MVRKLVSVQPKLLEAISRTVYVVSLYTGLVLLPCNGVVLEANGNGCTTIQGQGNLEIGRDFRMKGEALIVSCLAVVEGLSCELYVVQLYNVIGVREYMDDGILHAVDDNAITKIPLVVQCIGTLINEGDRGRFTSCL